MEETGITEKNADNFDTVTEQPMGEIRISVRHLVEFLLREGDIDNRHQGGSDNAMQEGSRIHRMIQKRMGADYKAEVFLSYTHPAGRYYLVVEGRADGIVDQNSEVMVDEIKGTYRDLDKLRRPVPVHLAQAKCYAYIYCLQNQRKQARVRMTYCNIETEDIRYFYQDFSFEELEEWFQGLIKEYRRWSDYSYDWKQTRQNSLEKLEFPFPYRDGQRELVSYVYQTIYHGKKLFVEAPTGVGKTISTVFPALKAMGRGMGDRLFYFTAKTITRTVADNTITLLRDRGLAFKSILLTAKDKICFLDKPSCNPVECPYAKGHYDRINDAVYDMLIHENRFDRERIEQYARKHQVCPFEFGLDMSLFADGIICDYNYLFDPHAFLRRFFADGNNGDYLFLIDEAHNLLERGREMYSAVLVKEDFLRLKHELEEELELESRDAERISKNVEESNNDGQLTLEMTGVSFKASAKKKGKKKSRVGHSVLVKQGYADMLKYQLEACNKEFLALKRMCENYQILDQLDSLVNPLLRLYNVLTDYLEETEEETLPVRDSLLDFSFEISHFLDMYERVDEHYVKYSQMNDDGSFQVKLFCVNPRENLKECMLKGRSTILFSATLLPIQYYKELLGGDPADYEVYAKSVFESEKRSLLIGNDITSKYTRRTEDEFRKMAFYIEEIVSRRQGNYMVFGPSYAFLQRLYETYTQMFGEEEKECMIQGETMSEEERELFLARFEGNETCDIRSMIGMEVETEEEKSLIGFCVLGGIFGEGIDLKNDSLIGVMIVGTGLPLVCNEREILKNYFDERGENGFDYAYRYPGMNKVLQAAGRVIRTSEDVGIIALLDERFLQFAYRKMFPREWEDFEVVDVKRVGNKVERFWDSWSKYER